MKKQLALWVLVWILVSACSPATRTLSFEEFGVKPDTGEDASAAAAKLVDHLVAREDASHLTIVFPTGRYDFYPEEALTREYYISNHDQDNPKKVGFALEELQNITIDGQGSEFIFHGRMIPFALLKTNNVVLKNFTVDFEIPAFRQLEVLAVDRAADKVITEIHPKGNHRIEGNRLFATGEGYENLLFVAMPFREDGRLAYRRQDVGFSATEIEEVSPDTLVVTGWGQTAYTSPGERFALRSYYRPTPGIFMSECKDTFFENITVHYAEGMGLLAQMSENITLDGFSVRLRGDDDPRYFTTQADATHFSACKGVISSTNGFYEGMADDAINVHGTYLRVTERVDDHTLRARYMHPQAWGFLWGEPGDTVQFVESERMELVGSHRNTIQSIQAVDQPSEIGAKEFEIRFTEALPSEVSHEGKYGIENLTWTPEVIFSNNVVRNNRARGALFSTPKRVVCEENLFDHTHGTAILLCGDCNGWFETGACREVIIRNNRFVNALTASYQFTNAVISIYPEIPDLEGQEQFFHSGIVIENNTFEMFDRPILYAKSTNGLIFRENEVVYNNDFEPFHWNKHPFFFEKVDNILIENNDFGNGFDPVEDVRVELSASDAVTIR